MSGALAYQEDYADYEIINGQTYMMSRPSMNHVRIEKNIVESFDRYLEGKRCEAILEQDVYFSEEDNFIPDVMIVCDPEIVKDDGIHGTPDLIVEILSPSTARKYKIDKKFKYEKYGVKEYWIVNPLDKSVEVYLRKDDKLILDDIYMVYPDYEWKKLTEDQKAAAKFEIKVSLYDDFVVKLEDIFARVK